MCSAPLWWGEANNLTPLEGPFRIELQFCTIGLTACRAVGMRLGRFEASQTKWRDETGSAVDLFGPFRSLAPPLTQPGFHQSLITNHEAVSWLLSVLWSQSSAALRP
jgi:hypothetical protein